ncbi:hypothetical protein NX059_005822 [Plenodomus lindquistii]|nr:hypothetical protein NX059_005822 [Plenodomus lindquistii]
MLNLALSNMQLSDVAKEASVKKLLVSKQGILGFFRVARRQRILGDKVLSADLGHFSCFGRSQCACPTAKIGSIMGDFLNEVIASRTDGTVDWLQLKRDRQGAGPIWTRLEAFFLDSLFSLCPNLKSITIQLPQHLLFDSFSPPVTAPLTSPLPTPSPELLCHLPFHRGALYIAQQILEALTISKDTRWKGPQKLDVLAYASDVLWRGLGKHTITLWGFRRLKRLDVPLAILGDPDNITFFDPTVNADLGEDDDETKTDEHSDDSKNIDDIGDGGNKGNEIFEIPSIRDTALPSTLKALHLRSCGKRTFAMLHRISEVPAGLLQLRHIEIFLETDAK